MTKFVFVTGGVVSSLGKGIAAASLSAILASRGVRVTNLKLDPFERLADANLVPASLNEFYGHQFWRTVFVQRQVEALGQTFVDFPPQQASVSFNVQGIVNQVKEQIRNFRGGN